MDEEVPFPLYTGKKLRTYNLLKRLQQKHQITYVCYGKEDGKKPSLRNVKFIKLRNKIIDQKGIPFYFSLLSNIFSLNPYIVNRHYSRLMKETINTLMKKEQFDLIHCEWTPYTQVIRDILPHPSVLSAHNVESQIWQRYFELERNFLKKYYIYLQWKKIFRYEKEICKLYNEIASVSSIDKILFEKWFGCKNINVVPNGVDEEYFMPSNSKVKPNSMVFTGSLDWRPNQEAVRYFLHEIFPLIQKEIPQVSFTVVGREPPEWFRKFVEQFKNVNIESTVEDIRPYIAGGALYVVPIRIGGGSRLKILEALSMGKLVLSTNIGAEGLEVRDGEHLFLRDTPESFAEAAIEMLAHAEKYEYLGHNGRHLILTKYKWDSIAEIMHKVWEKAVYS